MAVKIIDTKNTRIESRITSRGGSGTGESGVSIKDASGKTIVTAKKGGSSTTVQPTSTGVYDSSGRILPSAIQNDPNIKGDNVYIYKGNSKLLKSYSSQDAQNYLKQKYAEQEAKKAEQVKVVSVPVVAPTPIKTTQPVYTVVTQTPAQVIASKPTVINPNYTAQKAAEAKIKETPLYKDINKIQPINVPKSEPYKGNTDKYISSVEKVKESKIVKALDKAIDTIQESKPVKTVSSTIDKAATTVKDSKLIQADVKIVKEIAKANPIKAPSIKETVDATTYGITGGKKGSIDTVEVKDYKTIGIYEKGKKLADKYTGYVEPKIKGTFDKIEDTANKITGSKLVQKDIQIAEKLTGKNISSLQVDSAVKKRVDKAERYTSIITTETPAFLITGASAAPTAIEMGIRNPKDIVKMGVTAGGVAVGGTAKAAIDKPDEFVVSTLAIGGVAKGLTKVPTINPIKKSTLTEIVNPGSSSVYKSVELGRSFTIADTPIISYSKNTGIVKGGIAATPEQISGKVVTAIGKTETANFFKTIEKIPDYDYFKSGYDIARSVSKTKTPITEAKGFEITSKNIPDTAKPMVKEAIVKYKGDIEVHGSVAQEAQMKGYLQRQPADIEVYVDNPTKLKTDIETKLKAGGIKYQVSGENAPKFKFYDEAGKETKGIEIFGKKGSFEPKEAPGIDLKNKEYFSSDKIPYGFKEYAPIKVDGVKLENLRQQAAKKFEGGNTLQVVEGSKTPSIEVKYEGRIKDVKDIIDIGVGHVIEKKPSLEGTVITRIDETMRKYPGLIDKNDYITFYKQKGRLPTKQEFKEYGMEFKTSEPDILFKSSDTIRKAEAFNIMVKRASVAEAGLKEGSYIASRSGDGSFKAPSIKDVDSLGSYFKNIPDKTGSFKAPKQIDSFKAPKTAESFKPIKTIDSSFKAPTIKTGSYFKAPTIKPVSYRPPTIKTGSAKAPKATGSYNKPISPTGIFNVGGSFGSNKPATKGTDSYKPVDINSGSLPSFKPSGSYMPSYKPPKPDNSYMPSYKPSGSYKPPNTKYPPSIDIPVTSTTQSKDITGFKPKNKNKNVIIPPNINIKRKQSKKAGRNKTDWGYDRLSNPFVDIKDIDKTIKWRF